MEPAMSCSVVIPCHNGAPLTAACIASLRQQTDGYCPDEILLVDNASSDATPELAQLHPSVRVLRQDTNRGFAGGVNAGIAAARGELVLVLNNDTQAAPTLLRELHRALAQDTAIAAVAPTSNHVKGPARLEVGDFGSTAAGRDAIAAELASAPLIQDVDTLAGLCLLVRRATFAEVGRFDERFGHGNFEDDDFCLRLRLRGYRLAIAQRAFLHHEGHATFRALGLDLGQELARRRAQFIAKWQHDPAGAAHIAAWNGDLAAAAAAARTARTIWPSWPDADWHLARGCAARGDHAGASTHLAALLRHGPEHAEAMVALGHCQLVAGARREARVSLVSAVRHLLPAARQAKLAADLGADAFHRGDFDSARADFEMALLATPGDGVIDNWLGLCALATGNVPHASEHFAAAIAHGFPLAHTNLGICQLRQGEKRAAHDSFERAVTLLPHDPTARGNLAGCRALLVG
jgi:GT2 family glycosyltransferase/Tfp pilus assembly protein PilF